MNFLKDFLSENEFQDFINDVKLIQNKKPLIHSITNYVAMNFSANAFGLTNAATPIGLKAMEELQKENIDKTSASNAMCMLLAMNTAGFQLIPATVLAVLIGIGYKNPTEIIAPTLLVTTIAFVSAIILAKIFQKFWSEQNPRPLREREQLCEHSELQMQEGEACSNK